MKQRTLGKTDFKLTTVGLGCWAIGGGGWDYGWGPQDEKDSIETIIEALETGINWIDTAAVYGLGVSEEMVGKALRHYGKPVIVATKCGLLGNGMGQVSSCIKRDSIIREAEASLKRLRVDVIDLYQIHWPSPAEDIEEAFDALQILIKSGKIRYAGVSNFSVKQMEKIQPIGSIASLQPPYNYLERRIEEDVLPFCGENNIGVIAYSPMACGLLTGKVTPAWVASLPDDDWRKNKNNNFCEPLLSHNMALIQKLSDWANDQGRTVAELAISWVLRRPEVTAAIVGARKKGQILETVKATDWELSEADIEQVEAFHAKYQNSLRGLKLS